MKIATLSPSMVNAKSIPDDHLSASRVNTFNRCGMQYYFRHCEALVSPPSGALSLGSSFHVGVEHNYHQKIDSHEDLPVAEVLDAFSTDFDERKHETAWWEGEKPEQFKDQGIGLLQTYQGEIAAKVQPGSVERQFEIPFDNKDWTFTGRIDLVDNQDVIVETKTIGRTPPGPQPDHKFQTIAYTTGFRQEGGRESGARIDYTVKNKTPKTVSYSFNVHDAEIEFFLSQVARVALMIENEMFMNSRHLSPFPCSHRFCGYATLCESKIGGIVPER